MIIYKVTIKDKGGKVDPPEHSWYIDSLEAVRMLIDFILMGIPEEAIEISYEEIQLYNQSSILRQLVEVVEIQTAKYGPNQAN